MNPTQRTEARRGLVVFLSFLWTGPFLVLWISGFSLLQSAAAATALTALGSAWALLSQLRHKRRRSRGESSELPGASG